VVGCSEPAKPPLTDAPKAETHADGGHADHDHADEDHADHDHDHGDHKHPETLAEATTQIDEHLAEIKAAFAAGKDDEADDAVHELGHLFEDAEHLLDESKLDDDSKSAVKSALTDLFDAFNRIDEKLHGGEGSTYDDEKDKIDAAMATLKEHSGK
jgi:hypothetical protein